MDITDSKNSLKSAKTPLPKGVLRLGYSDLEPLKRVFNGLTPEQREAQTAALLTDCSTKLGSTNVIATTPQPRTIPLYIPLGPKLTEPTEITYAKAVAAHLSSECGRMVEVSELEGLFLYLWSEDDPEGRALDDYLGDSSRTLQALLLETRTIEGDVEFQVSAELLAFVGQRFEILPGR